MNKLDSPFSQLPKTHVSLILLGLHFKDSNTNESKNQYYNNIAKIWYYGNLLDCNFKYSELKSWLINNWIPLLRSEYKEQVLNILSIFQEFGELSYYECAEFNIVKIKDKLIYEIKNKNIKYVVLPLILYKLINTDFLVNAIPETYELIIHIFCHKFKDILTDLIYNSFRKTPPSDYDLWEKIEWDFPEGNDIIRYTESKYTWKLKEIK